MNVIAKISHYLALCHYTKTAQRIVNCSDIQYTSLTLDKKLNSLIYRTLFYVNIYGSNKLLKTVRFFGPPCVCKLSGSTPLLNVLTNVKFSGRDVMPIWDDTGAYP